MKKIIEYFAKYPKYPMMLTGLVPGFVIWLLYITVSRMFGEQPVFYYNLGEFMLGGMVVGTIIGMVFEAIQRQKEIDKK